MLIFLQTDVPDRDREFEPLLRYQQGRVRITVLTQSEADALIAMPKAFAELHAISLISGGRETRDLIGAADREMFILDLQRGSIRLTKAAFQTRGRKVVVLARLDVDGAPHTNPDGELVGRSHLHLYREGFEDRWATPVNPEHFPNLLDLPATLRAFCQYCTITNVPVIQESLL